VAGHPLRPATDRRLGEPLPHQLANQTRAHLQAGFPFHVAAHPVLATVSSGCPGPKGRFSRVTHPSATQPRKVAFDLHVLSRPPAFILSQDQTLHFEDMSLLLRKLYCSGILCCLDFRLGVAPLTKISLDEDWMLIWLSNY
jgi:hypothetical protein